MRGSVVYCISYTFILPFYTRCAGLLRFLVSVRHVYHQAHIMTPLAQCPHLQNALLYAGEAVPHVTLLQRQLNVANTNAAAACTRAPRETGPTTAIRALLLGKEPGDKSQKARNNG